MPTSPDTLAHLIATLRTTTDALEAVHGELTDLRQDNQALRELVAELNTQLAISRLQGVS